MNRRGFFSLLGKIGSLLIAKAVGIEPTNASKLWHSPEISRGFFDLRKGESVAVHYSICVGKVWAHRIEWEGNVGFEEIP